MNETRLIREFEEHIGQPIQRNPVPLEANESHDETFSYALCLRFYGKEKELENTIGEARKVLKQLLRTNNDKKKIEYMHTLIGDLYYIFGDFKQSAGFYMKNLFYNRNDITPWIGLLFSLRALGHFECLWNPGSGLG